MTEQLNIAELRRLHEAATPGDWEATGWEAGSHGHKSDTCCIAVKGTQTFLTGDIPETPRRIATHKLIAASRNAIPALLDAAEERDDLRGVLLRNNFAPCDIPACNCNGWHERATGDGFYARFREIEEAIGDHNGKTLLAAVVEMVQERDALKAKLAALVGSLEHIKDIMGGHDGCQGWSSPEDVWGIADNALAAAKVQP